MTHEEINQMDAEALLTAYALGELEGEDKAAVEQQLENDGRLREQLEQILITAETLREEFAQEQTPQLTEAQRERIALHVTPVQERIMEVKRRPMLLSGRFWTGSLLGAAACLLVVMNWSLLQTSESERDLVAKNVKLGKDISKKEMDEILSQATGDPTVALFAERKEPREKEGAMMKSASSVEMNGAPAPSLPSSVNSPGVGSTGLLDMSSSSTPGSVSEVRSSTGRQAGKESNESGQGGGAGGSGGGGTVPSVQGVRAEAPAMLPPPSARPIDQSGRVLLGIDGSEARASMGRYVGGLDGLSTNRRVRLLEKDERKKAYPDDWPQLSEAFRSDFSREAYDPITDNPFLRPTDNPLSTFSIDVDTASYSNIRRMVNGGSVPPPDAVRIEEMLNYFSYEYEPPTADSATPFAAHLEVNQAPWSPGHRLVKIGIKGKEINIDDRPATNLVFLIDVSGSMAQANKLPLLQQAFRMMVDRLNGDDRVAIVVYARAAGLVLPSTYCNDPSFIKRAIGNLRSGGSTAGGAGIELAYKVALDHYIEGGVNRVILATDGDFNVGVSADGSLVRLIEEKRKTGVFLSVLGFGTGNFQDAKMEKLSNAGNGNFAYIDSIAEAKKVLVDQLAGTLVTIAKDVKIQVEFNPRKVAAYRLIGYENRILAAEDFNNDAIDAGEIGAGHTVTALYEIIPAGERVEVTEVDELKYQTPSQTVVMSEELLTLKIRYKQPDSETSTKIEFPLLDAGTELHDASVDFRFATAVAEFGMILRGSPYKGTASFASVLDRAEAGRGADEKGYRAEFAGLVRRLAGTTVPQPAPPVPPTSAPEE